jgi:hypothetical protein
MRLKTLVLALPLLWVGCDGVSTVGSNPSPTIITVAGTWEGTAVTTSCTPASGAAVDICSVLTPASEFSFQLFLDQELDGVRGSLGYAGVFVGVGGLITESDFIRLAGTTTGTLEGAQFNIVVRSWNTSILGGGIAGSRMSGTWVTEATIQGEEALARAEHTIVAAKRTQ